MNFDTIKTLFAGDPNAVRVQTIAAPTALQFHTDPDTVFVDVRGHGEIAMSGTVQGAVRAPLPEFQNHAKPKGGGSLPSVEANKRIICVCASGARSGAAAQMLVQMGYREVANLRGGIGAWIAAGGPVQK